MVQLLKDFISPNAVYNLDVFDKILDELALVALCDDEGKISLVNKKFSDITGYQPEEIRGKTHKLINSGHHPETFFAQMWQTIRSGHVWHGRIKNRKKNGQTFWVQTSIYPVLDYASQPQQYLAISHDITAFKNALAIKDQFLANMSHELRTPLHSLVSLGNLMKETPLNTEQIDYVHNIQNAADVLLKMIEDLLDLNKIENGKLRFESCVFSPATIIQSACQLIAEKARDKHLEFIISGEQDLPNGVYGDPFRLKQILMHLLDNALKYTHQGSLGISSRLIKQTPELVELEFVISDTGIGIAPEKLDLITEKFQQAEMQDTRTYGGQGIGLSLVTNLIKLQQGSFNITSARNRGTIVSISIPYLKPAPEAVSKQSTENMVTTIPPPSSIKVLVAEDVDINQLVIRKHMQKFGFETDFAENGRIAIEKLKKAHYDIILMDMQMPIMDGYEAIRIIREEFPEPINKIPIISITASVLNQAIEKCLAAGANDYVPKPYDPNDLRLKMEKWIQEYRTQVNTFQPMENTLPGQDKASVIDLEYLTQLSEGDDDFSISMLSYFIDNTPVVLNELKEFYDASEWKALRNAAHKFKPQLTFMGIKSIFEDVENIEQSANYVQNTDQIPPLITKVDQVCRQAIEELKMELEKMLSQSKD